MGLVSSNYPVSLRSLKSVSINVIIGASAFPAMSLLLIENTVSEHEDVNPTTESAAVCLKRVAEAQFYVPRSQRRSSGLSRIVQNI